MLGPARELTELYGVASRRLRPRSILAARKAVRIFEREGLEAASRFIASLGSRPTRRPITSVDAAIGCAWRFRVAGRLIGAERRCLPECVAMCAGLWVMGCRAQIVVGHVTTHTTALSNVHSWLEWNGVVLTEDVIPGFYFEIDRYPEMDD